MASTSHTVVRSVAISPTKDRKHFRGILPSGDTHMVCVASASRTLPTSLTWPKSRMQWHCGRSWEVKSQTKPGSQNRKRNLKTLRAMLWARKFSRTWNAKAYFKLISILSLFAFENKCLIDFYSLLWNIFWTVLLRTGQRPAFGTHVAKLQTMTENILLGWWNNKFASQNLQENTKPV